MEDQTDLAAVGTKRLGHQVSGCNAVAIVVGRHDRNIVRPRHEAGRHVVHEHQLCASLMCRAVSGGSGGRIGRDRHDDVGRLGHDGFQIADLLFRLEACVGDGDHFDPHGGKLGLQPVDLRPAPVIAAVVHDDGCRGAHLFDLRELLIAQHHVRCGRRVFAARPLGQDGFLQLRKGRVGIGKGRHCNAHYKRKRGGRAHKATSGQHVFFLPEKWRG